MYNNAITYVHDLEEGLYIEITKELGAHTL